LNFENAPLITCRHCHFPTYLLVNNFKHQEFSQSTNGNQRGPQRNLVDVSPSNVISPIGFHLNREENDTFPSRFRFKQNRFRWAVLGLSQDEDWTDLFEYFIVNSWKRDLSNNITVNPPLLSLVITAEKSKICLRPSKIFCSFIKIYRSVVEATFKYFWRMLNVILNNYYFCNMLSTSPRRK
jgi:hypothetical protein